MKSNMNVKAHQQGFTLIELVVVIVILGILAVTAAPKFIDLTGDAKASTIEAVKGSLNSAADMAHAKALVKGIAHNGSLSIAGGTVTFEHFYPTGATIDVLMEIDTTTVFDFVSVAGSATYTHAKATSGAGCVVKYTDAADEFSKPVIASITSGC
ncbi:MULTISPECIES: prepilin-type N-terminal cleavage/methylation domain-containing protein [Colwellia]|uniref:MSHA pilin protein MshA n=1 Tax=Colwellia marinimaniae TaxID=1513592 RepID=A0ABQ0MQG2_9GAMM|nr:MULTISPECIES: prepilin-type N-terminal cleavage/methylation domain-containing protein [Colwellia]GAW94417.1 MSHA pilin protein MshA [Colwellia marinimaniae]